ncbi:hypothetical protein [Candidatus Thiodictyon syntrophicum]|jgi:hypothetical protein|uniref:hypothetical protein n=1 Tax=Candidatus Thiodictyon syntrophicum TaxID=1166950 RepID=UPI001C12B065|nr:hypothetical protein [Candidatus Thiodictyon syntrophicum]
MSIQKPASTTALVLTLLGAAAIAGAGVLDPDCTAQKAAKGAAAKATVGVGGRCSPAEAAKDTAKRAAGGVGKGAVKQPSYSAQGAAKKAVK